MKLLKERQGGIVLEAALVLPLFATISMLFVSMIRMSQAEMALHSMVSESAKVMAANLYPVEQLYVGARQQLAASAPVMWLEQVVSQANAARSQVVEAEKFVEDHSRFIPEPIVRLVAWEKEHRTQLEAAGGEKTAELKASIRKKAAAAATPLIASFGDTKTLDPKKLKVTDLQLPDFEQGQSAYVVVEAEYAYKLTLPFYTRTVILRKKATERAWIGG
ncbi:pilus assembly protein [Paenibacillus sp. YYML68]|uniref:pilus assembly protein n=1 Tax=Paenibacillus sp. YYML68 TaxID=2909250 RepID=UPI002493B129|nr:pilus assembly protein [Paenibacillus sp. YYML68]